MSKTKSASSKAPAGANATAVGPGSKVATLDAFLKLPQPGQLVRIASAYCTWPGVTKVQERLKPSSTVLLAGVDDGVTDPAIFKRRLALAGTTRTDESHAWLRDWEVRPTSARHPVAGVTSANKGRRIFHAKLILVGGGSSFIAYVGSGNLTNGGMGGNIEVGVVLRGRAAERDLEPVWAALRRWSVSLEAFDVADYERRRKFRRSPGAEDEAVPAEERQLILGWDPVGQNKTQIQFKPHIAHAFFGAFEDDEPSLPVKVVFDGTAYRALLSDHFKGFPEPQSFGVNGGGGLAKAVGEYARRRKVRRAFLVLSTYPEGVAAPLLSEKLEASTAESTTYLLRLVASADPEYAQLELRARGSVMRQVGVRSRKHGTLIAAVVRRDPIGPVSKRG